MDAERAAQLIMHATEKNDKEIYRENDNSDADFSDDDDSTYAPSTMETQYSDNEAMIQFLYSTDSGSESEEEENNPSNLLPTTSHDSSTTLDFSSPHSETRTGKDGTVWSASSRPHGRFRSHNVIRTRLHRVSASEICTPKDAFQAFLSYDIIEEILLCTNLQGRRVATKWKAVQQKELLAFIGVLFLAGVEKN